MEGASKPSKKRSSSTSADGASKKAKKAPAKTEDAISGEDSSSEEDVIPKPIEDPIEKDFNFQRSRDLNDVLEAPNPAWTPASEAKVNKLRREEQLAKKISQNAAKCGIRRSNFELLNVNNFSDKMKISWWVKEWPYAPAVGREPTPDEKKIQRNSTTMMMRGQTVLVEFIGRDPPNLMAAALLGFESVKAWGTWLDTQGSDLFRGIEILRRQTWQPMARGKKPLFNDCITAMNDRTTYHAIHGLLETVSNMTEHRTFHVLRGDIDPTLMPVNDRGTTHIAATILANILAALKFSTAGLDSNVRRFIPVEGDEANKVPYYYGYHADLWIGMMIGGFNKFHFRRHNIALDGKNGPSVAKDAILDLPYASPENMAGMVSAELGDEVGDNLNIQHSMDYFQHLEDFNPDSAPQISPTETQQETFMRRATTRFDFMCSSTADYRKFTAQTVKKTKGGKASTAIDFGDMKQPRMSWKLIQKIIDDVKRLHQEPIINKPDPLTAEVLQKAVQSRDGGMQSLMAGQEVIAESLAEVMDEKNLSHDEKVKTIKQIIAHAWKTGQMVSKSPPEHVDFSIVMEAFGLDPSDPRREQLQLNKEGNPDFTAMHHQLVDAWIMWQREQSLISGNILASQVGTGKTITAISTIILSYLDAERKRQAGVPFSARPTMMFVPAGLIAQTFDEVIKHFPGLIDIKCWYGVPSEFTGARREATLINETWEQELQRIMDPKVVSTNPKNALVLILTTYSTAQGRMMRKDIIPTQDKNYQPPDKVVYEPHVGAQHVRSAEVPNEEVLIDEEPVVDPDGVNNNGAIKYTATVYYMYLCKMKDAKFARIICDEAHCLRNPNGAMSRMIALLPRDATMLVTATPVQNRLRDYKGLLDQIWISSRLPLIDRYNGRLFKKDYDIQNVNHLSSENGKGKEYSPFKPDATPEDIQALKDFCAEKDLRPWAIMPACSDVLAKDETYDVEDVEASDNVYKAAFKSVQLRRSMRDGVKVTMPTDDGEEEVVFYPGQHIPGHEIIMEELGHKGERKAKIEQLTNAFLSEINTAGSGMEPALPDTKDGPKENTDGRLNMLVHRILLLNAFDLRTAEIFAAEDSISQKLTPDELRQAVAKKATGSYSGTLPTVARKKKGKAEPNAEDDEAPKLGVDQVNHLRAMDPDGGLSYIWNLTEYRQHHILPPADRAGMLIGL